MALQKQTKNIPVALGMDTKTDPFQLTFGKFTFLKNCIFSSTGRIQKRNGHQSLTALVDTTTPTFTTVFNEDLLVLGENLQAYSSSAERWFNRGPMIPLQLNTFPLVRSNTSQTTVDSVTSPGGIVCTVFTDQDPSNLSNNIFRYCISDVNTGIYLVPPTQITPADGTYGTPRVFLLPGYFIICYTTNVAGTYHLKYIAVSISSPTTVTSPADIAATYTPSAKVAFDGAVLNGILYIAYNGAGSSGIKIVNLNNSLTLSSTVTRDGSHVATQISVSVDPVYQYVWVTYYNVGTTSAYALCVNPQMSSVLAGTLLFNTGTILNITSLAQGGILNVFYEVSNAYSFNSSFKTNYIKTLTINTSGTVSSDSVVLRSVGLASKAYQISGNIYFLTAYQSQYQSSYFLVNSSGNVIAKVAYQNGGGYVTAALPSVTVQGNESIIPYRFQFAISSVNKSTGVGVYGQTGLNLATFSIETSSFSVSEIGQALNISGGFLWSYDGNIPVEQNFFLWPDLDPTPGGSHNTSVCIAPSNSGGSMVVQDYFYIATYEWQDNQGNIFRSGVSLIATLKSGDLTGSSNSAVISVPTLRLTYKISSPVKLVLYRASDAQQTYYQVTSVTLPTLNSVTVDSIDITDTYADSSITGNTILYTNGGILENTGGPCCSALSVFDNRLWMVLPESPNTLAFSQPIVDQTPVEMSLFLTKYISPTVGATHPTGAISCLFPMDDKFILYRSMGISYFNGTGPTLAGANSFYSEPVFVDNTVGCTNQNSIVNIPQGQMFQADNDSGIWLLTRDLQIKYIGSEVEDFNSATVLSAQKVPGQTYVVFALDSGVSLMYDYLYNQWGIFSGMSSLSATVYQGSYTYLTPQKTVLKETENYYLDGSSPVLIGFQTGWINLAGLQGYQRAYALYLLGTYQSPHKIQTGLSYDYNSAVTQAFTITPVNSFNTYGSQSPYGQSGVVYGGTSQLEQFRINFKTQKCQSFQLNMQEVYDSSQGVQSGAGFTLSGADIVFGYKKGYPRLPAAQTVG